jgi:hypothetical protein
MDVAQLPVAWMNHTHGAALNQASKRNKDDVSQTAVRPVMYLNGYQHAPGQHPPAACISFSRRAASAIDWTCM